MRPDDAVPAGEAGDGSGSSGGLKAAIHAFRQATAGRALDAMDLVAAELRLAAMAGLSMLIMGLLAFAAVLAAWVFLVVALLSFATQAGWSWPAIALLVSVLHLLAAGLLYRQAMKLTADLTLPATRAALRARDAENS